MLTEKAIKALQPRDIRYYVSDNRGLWLEVFPQGGMAWRYRYRLIRTPGEGRSRPIPRNNAEGSSIETRRVGASSRAGQISREAETD